jgi:hypothetical protein
MIRFVLTATLLCLSCDKPTPSPVPTATPATAAPPPAQKEVSPYTRASMLLKDILINGSPAVMPTADFAAKHPGAKAQPQDFDCADPFDIVDEAWMTQTYGKMTGDGVHPKPVAGARALTVKGAVYLSNNHVVLFQNATADSNTLSFAGTGIELNASTTPTVLRRLLPTAQKGDGDASYSLAVTGNDFGSIVFTFVSGKLASFSLVYELC